MAILLNNNGGENQAWAEALESHLPEMPIHIYPEIPDPSSIDYAVVWHHPHGDLNNYPNLKAILVLGAGMDHIDQETSLPDVPIVRLVDPTVGDEMSQYVLYWVMHFQRGYERYRAQQSEQHWQRHMTPFSRDYRVSVLGAGLIGRFVSERLAATGFCVHSWNRSQKEIDKVRSFSGEQGMHDMLAVTDVLVNCLPLNSATKRLLNKETLSMLPKGANLISLSRGAIIDDQALIDLIDSGHIANAALDTFSVEPLSNASPYWGQSNVFVTPHMSGSTYPQYASEVIANNIKRIEQGEQPFPVYKPRP